MNEKPICVQCESFCFKKAVGTCGWEAFCRFRPSRWRTIEVQYGLSSELCKAELKDKMHSRVRPGWCPKMKGDTDS